MYFAVTDNVSVLWCVRLWFVFMK